VVVAKLNAEIVTGAAAQVSLPADDMRGDQANDAILVGASGAAERSLRYPSDYAVFKQRADVVLIGHAYAPGGLAGAAMTALRFGSAENGFVRRIAVLGERRWENVLGRYSPSVPAPFRRLPLIYERAFGGAGFADNPLGVGFEAAPDACALPNLEDPDALMASPRDRPPAACFGPRSRHWGLSDLSPGEDFPSSFDWSRYQCAPKAQQLDRVSGDEAFACHAMHPDQAVLAGRLPALRARCVVANTDAAGGGCDELPLTLDTVHFDLDALRLTLVWRGRRSVSDERAPEVSSLFVALEPMSASPAAPEQIRARLKQQGVPSKTEE
jgi:hypothetical protein